jgi:hypothetical protein
VSAEGRQVEVELGPGEVRWLGAQEHVGENVGNSATHVIFVELKEAGPGSSGQSSLGPR